VWTYKINEALREFDEEFGLDDALRYILGNLDKLAE